MRGKSTSPKLFGGGKINMFVNSRGKWIIPTVQRGKLFINLNRSKNMTNRLALPSNYFNVIVSTDATGVWNAKYLPTATRQAAIHAMGHTNTWQFNILVTFALASSGKKDIFFEFIHFYWSFLFLIRVAPAGLKYSISSPDWDGTTLRFKYFTKNLFASKTSNTYQPHPPWMWPRFQCDQHIP